MSMDNYRKTALVCKTDLDLFNAHDLDNTQEDYWKLYIQSHYPYITTIAKNKL